MNRTVSIFLDLLRVGAALTVVLTHFTQSYAVGWPSLGEGGGNAVAVFFVLSGFVISYVVERKERDGRTYAIARLARLYSVMVPAIVLTGVVMLVVAWLRPELSAYYAGEHNLLGLRNTPELRFVAESGVTLAFLNALHGHQVYPGIDMPAWSLGFEGPYYLMFAVAVFCRGWVRAALLVGCALLFGGDILRLFPVWLGGVALQRGLRGESRENGVWKGLVAAAGVAAGVWAWPLVAAWSNKGHGAVADWVLHGRFHAQPEPQFYFWGAMTGVAIYAVAMLEPWLRRALAAVGRPIQWFAGHTFSVYLYHLPLLVLFSLVPYRHDSRVQASAVLVGVLGCCVLLSEVTERQKPRWRRLVARGFDAMRIGGAETRA